MPNQSHPSPKDTAYLYEVLNTGYSTGTENEGAVAWGWGEAGPGGQSCSHGEYTVFPFGEMKRL